MKKILYFVKNDKGSLTLMPNYVFAKAWVEVLGGEIVKQEVEK